MRRMPARGKTDRSHGYVAGGNNVFIVRFRNVRMKKWIFLMVADGHNNNRNKIIECTCVEFAWIQKPCNFYILKEL